MQGASGRTELFHTGSAYTIWTRKMLNFHGLQFSFFKTAAKKGLLIENPPTPWRTAMQFSFLFLILGFILHNSGLSE